MMVMAGGVLIAVLRHWYAGEGLSEQIESTTRRAHAQKARDALLLALMAIVAVGFGGAVGPEAGILAVASELSALVSMLIARNAAEERFIAETGAAGALGGLYGSPQGGAMLSQEQREAPRWQIYLAGVAGLLDFLLTANWILPGNSIRIELPEHVSMRDGADMLGAILPAMVGAATGHPYGQGARCQSVCLRFETGTLSERIISLCSPRGPHRQMRQTPARRRPG